MIITRPKNATFRSILGITILGVRAAAASTLHSGDPREAYLERKHNFLNNGQYGNSVLKDQADAIFFVAEVNGPGGRPQDDS